MQFQVSFPVLITREGFFGSTSAMISLTVVAETPEEAAKCVRDTLAKSLVLTQDAKT